MLSHVPAFPCWVDLRFRVYVIERALVSGMTSRLVWGVHIGVAAGTAAGRLLFVVVELRASGSEGTRVLGVAPRIMDSVA